MKIVFEDKEIELGKMTMHEAIMIRQISGANLDELESGIQIGHIILKNRGADIKVSDLYRMSFEDLMPVLIIIHEWTIEQFNSVGVRK